MTDQFDPYRKWLGIPAKDQPPHHYRLLGIDAFESDAEVICNAADARMVHIKTFQAGQYSELSQQILNEIAAAKVCLLTPAKKAAYDETLRRQAGPKRPALAKAIPLAESAPPVRQSPSKNSTAATADFAPSAVPTHLGRRRRRSSQSPVLIAVGLLVAAAVVAVAAVSMTDRDPPAVAEQPGPAKSTDRGPSAKAPAKPKQAKPTPPESQGPDQPAPGPIEKPAAPPDDPPVPPDTPPEEEPDRVDPVIDPPGTEDPETPPVPAVDPPEEVEPLPTKLPLPVAAAQRTSEQQIREIFAREFADAKTLDKKRDLAEKLLRQGDETSDDPASRFVLFRLAAGLAATAGETELAMQAVDRIAGHYQADATAIKVDVLEKAVATAPGDQRQGERLLEAAQSLAEEARADDDFATAGRLAKVAIAAARKTRDTALVREVVAWNRDLEKLAQRYAAVTKALDALAANPDDPVANLAVGSWYALETDRWEQGLPHLAKGSDGVLAALARRDLETPAEADARLELGDAWWDLGETRQGDTRLPLLARATHWYELAVPELSGLSRAKAEKRLEEFAALEAAGKPGTKKKGKYFLAFDGRKSHVLVPDFKYDGTVPLTVEAIVVPASVADACTVVGNMDGGGWALGMFDLGRLGLQNRHWSFLLQTENRFGGGRPGGGFGGRGGFPSATGSTTPAVANQRVMLAAVYDGQQLRFYLNGQTQMLRPRVQSRHRPGADSLWIGAAPDSDGPKDFFHGVIEQVRISNVARYVGNYPPPPKLEKDKVTQLLFLLDEGEGSVAHDASGHKHDGKIVGATWIKRP